jgi:hypothetical protein
MKHISRFDGCVYQISRSMDDENGKLKNDDITLIWRDAPCGFEAAEENRIPHREFVDWYWGEYDYKIVESYIRKYYERKLNKEN